MLTSKKTLIIVAIILTATGVFLFLKMKPSGDFSPISRVLNLPTRSGGPVSIPQEILANQFGFLSGHPGSEKEIAEMGAKWARPHSGPFVWDIMQKSKNDEIDFSYTDVFIKNAQKEKLGTLATIFPYADWEQKMRDNPEKCRVPANDEFAPEGREKVGKKEFYLPYYRCNPTSWERYAVWVKALVERYDGDGTDDMPGLKIPVKYWEISNEPDLVGPEEFDEPLGRSLTFYIEGPENYAELLKKSHQFIKEADLEAKVLISGAAGGGDWSLKFYRQVFRDKETINSFDIANVHCISNDSYDSFNVEPYKKMLAEFGIQKPIWVTEAEAIVERTMAGNMAQTRASTEKALALGAEKIFYTRFSFEPNPDDKGIFMNNQKDKEFKDKESYFEDKKPEDEKMSKGKPWIDESLEAYKRVFESLGK